MRFNLFLHFFQFIFGTTQKSSLPRVSLIITTYNWPKALNLVLKSIELQTILPNEIIIADDGSSAETAEVIKTFQKCSPVPVIHSWQENIGFRAARSRNKAIALAKYEYIIILDGDMILHPDFIYDHLHFAQENTFVQGKRAKISEERSTFVLETSAFTSPLEMTTFKDKYLRTKNNFLSFLFSGKRYFRLLHWLQTCNMAFYKKDFLRVNGFNEDFVGWGREDSEFGARMLNAGVIRRDLQFAAYAYHLHHKGNSSGMLSKNNEIYMNTVNRKLKYCENGVNNHLISPVI